MAKRAQRPSPPLPATEHNLFGDGSMLHPPHDTGPSAPQERISMNRVVVLGQEVSFNKNNDPATPFPHLYLVPPARIVTPPRTAFICKGKGIRAYTSSSQEFYYDCSNKKRRLTRRGTHSIKKPPRPLSAYNLFFRDERRRLPAPGETPEGEKLGFIQMAKLIAPKWKALDAKARKIYENCAVQERKRYFVAMARWEREQDTMLRKGGSNGNTSQEHEHGADFSCHGGVMEPPYVLQEPPVLPNLEEQNAGRVSDEELREFLSTLDFS